MIRTQRTSQEWTTILMEQKASGQSIPKWCESHGVKVGTVRNQIMKRRKLSATQNNVEAKSEEKVKQNGNGFMEVTTMLKKLTTADEMGQGDTDFGRLYIEIGNMRLVANTAYPAGQLAELCKELIHG